MVGYRKVFVKDTWMVSQSVSGFIGTVKAKSLAEAKNKAKWLIMYDYDQDTKVKKFYRVE
jgi:hypothetical protein